MTSRDIAQKIVEGSLVLLKNEDGLLPLARDKRLALFGRAQLETVLSGSGSGAARTEHPSNIVAECQAAGFPVVTALLDFYREQVEEYAKAHPREFDFSKLAQAVTSGLMYEIFGKYAPTPPEFAVPQDLVDAAAQETDTALLVIGRSAGGEECDRHLENDYYLSETELALVGQLSRAFPNIVVILNCNGLIDLSWVEKYPAVKSLLFLGAPGEQGPAALARILCGEVAPSGKLAVTIAKEYGDYPAAENFSWDKDHPEHIRAYKDYGLDAAANGSQGFACSPATVYKEDIYLGYRYADTLGVKPLFPFGFGLSYTEFGFEALDIASREDGLLLTAQVENRGDRAGREVLQLYVSALNTESPRPYQELKGFAKTDELAPHAIGQVQISLPWRELACYSEDAGAWVIEKGSYLLRLGNSSVNTVEVSVVEVPEAITIQKTGNRMSLQACNRDKIAFLSPESVPQAVPAELATFVLSAAQVEARSPALRVPEDCGGFSIEELAALCVGYGAGLPFAGLLKTEDPPTLFDENGEPVTANDHPVGYNGYVSPAIGKRGIHSVFYKDGPAGIGTTAYPTEMLVACSFDTELCREFGDAVGAECEAAQVDVWLAPALNLHRHPLGGRNFEYFSEDPFLSGACACAVLNGVQENHPVLVCAKHFACNEQETYRRGSSKESEGLRTFDAVDSVLTERAARELYLKPFEMLVGAGLHCMMTSFNKINGVFAGGSKDLCTHILREEWGFDGAVVTDWGDMDIVVDGADAVAAGNDIVMPGGPPVIRQILDGYREGRVTREELETAVGHLIHMLGYLGRFG